jgi:hypothetical protein
VNVLRSYGEGIFRRRIRLVARSGTVVADLEDDFHRFRVTVEHDGRRATRIAGEARRYPWTSCPGAEAHLESLAGLPLLRDCRELARHADPRASCTHLLDLAGLAVAHAAAGRAQRQYDAEVPDRDGGRNGQMAPRLHRDGVPLLEWRVDGSEITDPPRFAGRTLRGAGFLEWVRRELDEDLAEAATVLRRACFIAIGRSTPMDRIPEPKVFLPQIQGTCHTFTPEVAEHARRMVGATLEFTDGPERLLADLGD